MRVITSLAVVGVTSYLIAGLAFARHASRIVFNRQPPSVFALFNLLPVTRPLEMMWRFATAKLRCTPQIFVLGEVRCGTTTLASLLRDRLGLVGPFTPWVHPLANEKESFYFSGHYCGIIKPSMYSMCFPLLATVWLYRRVLHRPYHCFEACASYLSSPWLPPLLKRVLGKRPAVFIVCLREPVSQHISWWRLEHNGMAWGSSMGLGDESWLGPPVRLAGYPPATLRAAVDLSRSEEVEQLWSSAEGLSDSDVLPEWAAPFPNGQLSSFDHMGRYADTIERWLCHFPRDQFVFTTLDEIATDSNAVLARIEERCQALLGVDLGVGGSTAAGGGEGPRPPAAPRLNDSMPIAPELEPDAATLRELGSYYKPHNERLFQLLGEDLGWHRDERYWWYRRSAAGPPSP